MTDVNGSHCFGVGQIVRRTTAFGGRPDLSLRFEVVRQLPGDGQDFLYRIRNADEGFERVVAESDLADAQALPQ